MATRQHPCCGLCGGQVQAQRVQGWPANVCASCASVTLDAQAARQILGPEAVPRLPSQPGKGWYGTSDPAVSSDTELALHIERLRATRQRRVTLVIAAATSVVILLLAVPLSFVVYGTVRGRMAASPPGGPTLTETILPRPPVVVVPPTETPPVRDPDPAPADAAADPPSEVPVPGPLGVRALVKQGWSLADRSPAEAAARFRAALAQAPSDPEANYGVGYTALKVGDRELAGRHLCAALPGADLDMRREIEAFQKKYQLSCPP